jgi:hypothetical protein
MHKNKIVLMLAFGIMLSPLFVLQAADVITPTTTSTSADATVQANVSSDIKEGFKNKIQDIQNSAKQEATKIKQEAQDAQKSIIDAAKQQRDNLNNDLQTKIGEIRSSTTLTAEQKVTEIKDLQDKKIADLKAAIQVKQEDLKANVTKKIEDLKSNIDTRKAEITKQIEAKKSEIKTMLVVKAQENVKALLEKIYANLNSKIEKLTGVDVTILAKINASSANGIDVTSAKAQYTIARAALDKAIIDIAATKTISIDQTSIQTSKETLRALVKTAEDSIKAAGAEYQKIIPLITITTDTKVETTTTNTVTQ